MGMNNVCPRCGGAVEGKYDGPITVYLVCTEKDCMFFKWVADACAGDAQGEMGEHP